MDLEERIKRHENDFHEMEVNPIPTSFEMDGNYLKIFSDLMGWGAGPLGRWGFNWFGVAHYLGLIVYLDMDAADKPRIFRWDQTINSRMMAKLILDNFDYVIIDDYLLELGFIECQEYREEFKRGWRE